MPVSFDPVHNGDAASFAQRVIRISSPRNLLALVPHLLGFYPQHSLVVIGTDQKSGRVRVTMRYDLPPTRQHAQDIASHAGRVLRAQDITTATAVGYGPGTLVTPAAEALQQVASQAGIKLSEILRADDQRYWSYLCTSPECCPPEGVPYDTAADRVTATYSQVTATMGTEPGVLASREVLAATVAALDGEAGEAMRDATRCAEGRAAQLAGDAAGSGGKGAARRIIATVGRETVRTALDLYRGGGTFRCDADAAWLGLVLRDLRVRDDAWARMEPEYRTAHLRLWTDLTRRSRPGYIAAPAALLAFTAWQSGNGALANVALDRALEDDPEYSMASLLRQVLDSGAPPSLARLPMTPEEVARSYAEDDEDDSPDSGDGSSDDEEYAGPDEEEANEDDEDDTNEDEDEDDDPPF